MPAPAVRKFAAIIFDCDGVLVDSEILAIKGERRALGEMGLEYSPKDYVTRFVGLHDAAFLEVLRQDYAKKFERPAPEDFEANILEGRRREMSALRVIDGAAAAMTAAKQAGGIAVASSSRAHFLESKMKRMSLWDIVAPHVYSADLVANGKPAPDIFLFAAKRLDVHPSGCLVIEDSENGVRAGVAAGMTVWGFTGGGHCFEGHGDRLLAAGASWIAPNFEGLIKSSGFRSI